ncbi:helix-turn-helix domain-containing protein [Salipiger mangrovisoli]|uniref:helix-turn-helix domain-containing protein n=1 Tax=Salipiger mangrovisoli TaxID=2865933 RepID=UPI001F120D70|nr:helix-turn-helix domain-containing protein [Salipiger mangrovisoli]
MTETTTARLIADAIDGCGKTQRQIADEMGYERPNVISMMRIGEMRIPIERIPAFAKATGIAVELLTRTAMAEYMPEAWKALAVATPQEVQLNVPAPSAVVERFKRSCQTERRSYGDMLEILLDICLGREDRAHGLARPARAVGGSATASRSMPSDAAKDARTATSSQRERLQRSELYRSAPARKTPCRGCC